jgi:hypothetical protein
MEGLSCDFSFGRCRSRRRHAPHDSGIAGETFMGWAGMAVAEARPCAREQASRDGRLSDANLGQAPDRPTALPDR